jgi:hypothetical protein
MATWSTSNEMDSWRPDITVAHLPRISHHDLMHEIVIVALFLFVINDLPHNICSKDFVCIGNYTIHSERRKNRVAINESVDFIMHHQIKIETRDRASMKKYNITTSEKRNATVL